MSSAAVSIHHVRRGVFHARRDGDAARALIDAARAEDADLVVTGRRGRGALAELVLGSTTYHLVHHLDRSLVIVP